MSKTISHRPPQAQDHAASTRTDGRPASGKRQKEVGPSVATAFKMIGKSATAFAKEVGDTTRRLAKSARVFSHTIHTETQRPDTNLIQAIEDGFADAAQALAPKPDFAILADEAEEYLDTIRHLATSDPKLKSAALEMAAQYQGILGAGIATAVWDYHHDPDSRPVAQRQAMDFADAFYREVPTEESLDGVFATYAAVDRDVAKMRRAVARNTDTIRTYVSKTARVASQPLLDAADRSLPMGDIQFQKHVPAGPEAVFLQTADHSHVFARAENAILEPLLTATESRITTLVQSTHVDSKFYREAHLGMAHVHMGDPQTGVRHLESARMIFRDKGDAKPPTNELSTQIEILHRIATHSPDDAQLAKDRLSEADSMIDLLGSNKGNRDKATLFRIDNLLHTLPHHLQEHDGNLKHNPDNIEAYHHAVAREHQKIIAYCSRVKSRDPAIVALAHGNGMIQASVQFEKRLDAAMSLRLMGETDDARNAHLDAQNKFTQTLRVLERTASPTFMHEAMGRMHWANATYTFKTGAVEESLKDLRTLSTTYGASGAAQILKEGSGEVWVHHYGIVDDHGNFSPDIGKPSEIAKWKKIADAVLSDKASATQAMMAGAGMAIVGTAAADALLGTHVIGAKVLGGLTLGKIAMVGAGAGLITERGYQVLPAQRDISAAYTTGIANVTTEELADRGKALAGEVAVCFLAGGAARYVRMGVTTLGAGLRAPLLRGLISESGIVAEGIAFHEFAGAIHGETDRSALGYFRSVLTLRMLAAGSELNLGSLLFPGEKWADAVMRHGVNTAVANIPLQTFESAIARDLSGFGQGYFDSLFSLYAITVGGKIPETVRRAPQILAQARARHQDRSARKLITRAETLANTISTLQSNRDYARTPTEKTDLTQKLITAMRAHAAAYQKIAQMGLYPADAATVYAEGVEAFAKISEAAAQPTFETTPLRQRIARALLLPVAPIFGTTGPIEGGGRKVPGGDVTQVGIKRGLGDKPPEVSEPPQPPPQPQKQTQHLRPKPRIPIPAFITPRAPAGRVQVELAPPEHRAMAQDLNVRLITEGNESAFASAGITNTVDNGMQFFSPYAPGLFIISANVEPHTGAIKGLNTRTTHQIADTTPNTINAAITVFSPWASASLTALHSKAMGQRVRDSDPVPPWVLSEIEKIVESCREVDVEGEHKGQDIRIPTQFPEWFAFVNSERLTLGEVFSERVVGVSGKALPSEIEAGLQHALVGKPYRIRNAASVKPSHQLPDSTPQRPKWMDDPRIASALWVLNPENAPNLYTVSEKFRYNPKGDNDLVYAILEISRAIAGGSPLTDSYLNRLHHLFEAIPQHPDLFRPTTRVDTASTESNLEAHLRAAYAESPNVVLYTLKLLEENFQLPGAFRRSLRTDFRATQPVKRPRKPQASRDVAPQSGEDGLATANDKGLRKELRIPDPVTAPPKPAPPPPAGIEVIEHNSGTLAAALDGNLNDIIPPKRYGRRDLTGFASPSDSTFIVRARINAQTAEPLTLGLTTEMPEVTHTAVINIRVVNGKVISIDVNSNQHLHLDVLDIIRRNLMGKPVRAKPLERNISDVHHSVSPPPNSGIDIPSRLGIVGGEAGKYPTLPNRQRAAWEADRITTQEFYDALADHFHPSYFKALDLLNRREAIIDHWVAREDAVEVDYWNKSNRTTVTSPASRQLHTTDAFLALTQVRSEVFAALLDLRVEAQLRTKLGTAAKLTDMDLEAERNHVLAEVLSEGIGVHIPIAKGKFSISTAEGVIVLRPDRAEDYASIDLAVQSGDTSGEVLTGGFYCHKSAVGLPFVVINPAMGDRAWGIIRHELQHLRKHASNRFEPHFKMPTPNSVSDYPTALRQHFGITAKDEILAYLEGATPPQETIATLTKPNGIYDAIAKHRGKIQLSDNDVATLKQEHSDYVTQQVWVIHEAVVKLIGTGWHPEAARHALIDSLSEVPFMSWGTQLPMAVGLLLTTPPQRQAPPPTAHEGHRPELRRFLESKVLSRRTMNIKTINTLAQRQNKKMEAIERETRGPVDTGRLQALRQELQTGNSEMGQLAEVLQLLMDECRGQIQVIQRRHATDAKQARAIGAQFRKLSNRLNRLDVLTDKVAVYLKSSGITELQTRLDRLLLIRTAHSQKLMRDSAEQVIKTESMTTPPPHIRGKDVARMNAEDQLSHISKLRNAMVQAKSTGDMARAANLYATYVRHGLLTQQMRSFEFEALMTIATTHPEWMPHLKHAFLGLGGAMKPEQWQHLLQTSIPTPSPEAAPRPALSLGAKTRLINDIERYRQKLDPSTQTAPHISRAIDALDAALRKNAPMPHVVVRYGMLTPSMIDNVILHGAPKEYMARYFIVKEGQKRPAAQTPHLTLVEMDVPLDRFVRFLMESTLPLNIDGKYIVTTERTNAAFNNFLMNNFVRRHVTIQEGLLTPKLIFHARRGVITLDVSTIAARQRVGETSTPQPKSAVSAVNSNQNLHPDILSTLRNNLIGKPVREKPMETGMNAIAGAAFMAQIGDGSTIGLGLAGAAVAVGAALFVSRILKSRQARQTPPTPAVKVTPPSVRRAVAPVILPPREVAVIPRAKEIWNATMQRLQQNGADCIRQELHGLYTLGMTTTVVDRNGFSGSGGEIEGGEGKAYSQTQDFAVIIQAIKAFGKAQLVRGVSIHLPQEGAKIYKDDAPTKPITTEAELNSYIDTLFPSPKRPPTPAAVGQLAEGMMRLLDQLDAQQHAPSPSLPAPKAHVSPDMQVHLRPFVNALMVIGPRARRDTVRQLETATQEWNDLEGGRPPTRHHLERWQHPNRAFKESGYQLAINPENAATMILDTSDANTRWQKTFTDGVQRLLPEGIIRGMPAKMGNDYFIPAMDGWFWGGDWLRSEEKDRAAPFQGRIFFGVDYGLNAQNTPKASVLYAELTQIARELETEGIDIQFKISAKRKGRNDAGVLYFRARDEARIYEEMQRISRLNVTADHLPLFVAPLTNDQGDILPGIGFAQHPRGGGSFLQRRTLPLQAPRDALAAEAAAGQERSPEEINGILAAALEASGVDPEIPAFDQGGRELFPHLYRHMRFSREGAAPTQTISTKIP